MFDHPAFVISAEVAILVMPAEKFRCRTFVLTTGNHHKRFSSMLIVLPPVFEFLFDSIADLYAQILGHRYIRVR